MPAPLAYLSGRFLPASEAALSVFDLGIVSGVTVTDFCRTYHHRLFRHADHVARFRRDCAACFVPLPASDETLFAVAAQLVAQNAPLLPPGDELALITFATPGPIGGPPTLVMHTTPLPASRYQKILEEGALLAVVGHHAADPDDLAPPRHKHRSRLHWWRAEQMLPRTGEVALLLDGPGGCVTETAVGNLLVVSGGAVSTPPVGYALDGVSLAIVRELCAALGVAFVERRLKPADCLAADEMMLVGSGFGLAGVRSFDGTAMPCPGPLTRRLRRAWDDVTSAECGVQNAE
jgi:branched-chain amino acid aminotransferase